LEAQESQDVGMQSEFGGGALGPLPAGNRLNEDVAGAGDRECQCAVVIEGDIGGISEKGE